METTAAGTSATPALHVASAKGWLTSRPWAVVALLTVIGILNMVDRLLPSILAEPIKRDLELSDTALGLINGAAFLLIYAVAGIFIAKLSDKGHYSSVICGSLALWSVMTMVAGWVAVGWQLALARVGVALGEAGASPAAHAYITRHFPIERRTTALAVFTMSLPIGSMVGFAVGGYLGEALGWRNTFIVIGLLGVVLSVFAYFALPRTNADSTRQAAIVEAAPPPLTSLVKSPSLVLIIAGQSAVAMGAYAAVAFGPAYLMRSHGMALGNTGLMFGLYSGGFGILLLMITGGFSDRLSAKDMRWLPGVATLMTVATIPLSVASLSLSDPTVSIIGLALVCVVPAATVASAVSSVHQLVPVELRARTSAVLLFANSVLGSLGPLITGAVSDWLKPTHGDESLGYALLVVPLCFVLGGLFFGISVTKFRADLDRSPGAGQ